MSSSPEKPATGFASPSVTGTGPAGVADSHSDMFFAAVETTRMPMIVTDPHQRDNPIVFVNRAFERMSGYRRAELLGVNCRFLQGPQTSRDTVAELRRHIAERKEFATEILNYRKDGSTFWNALFISPVFSPSGELVYFFGSQLDVSRRRDVEEALHQAQKMESLGQLTGGIAHDFNNLLQVIGGYNDVILAMAEAGTVNLPRLVRAGEAIRSASDRAAKLTQQLLAFARKQRLEGRAVNLNALFSGLSELAGRTLGDDVALELKLEPDLWTTRIDPTQAEVALLNILINARDAMPGGGRLVVETGNLVLPEEAGDKLAPGNYVTMAITDTGTGMPPEVMARVMEPFFTTKGEGKGTGLGLAMVYGFARQSGGAVRIASTVGAGTTIRLLFPATGEAVAPEAVRSPGAADRGGSETVLVVDDRVEVAEAAAVILQDFGYDVTIAKSPAEALAILDGQRRVDLLFTDIVMPGGMDGVTLARHARERHPGLKVLLTTGFAGASLDGDSSTGAAFAMIGKPYRRLDLVRRVRQVLDAPDAG